MKFLLDKYPMGQIQNFRFYLTQIQYYDLNKNEKKFWSGIKSELPRGNMRGFRVNLFYLKCKVVKRY